MDKHLLEIINLVITWQLENDKEFKPIPNDDHYYLDFNSKNNTISFIFSNKTFRDKCKSLINMKAMNYFDCMHDDDKRFTYFKI